MITIYHNPRCSKSREGLDYLEKNQLPYKVVKYLDEPLTENEIQTLLTELKIKPIELVRTKESIWKELFAAKNPTDTEIITALSQYPKLIERPILSKNGKAVIGRPISRVEEIL